MNDCNENSPRFLALMVLTTLGDMSATQPSENAWTAMTKPAMSDW